MVSDTCTVYPSLHYLSLVLVVQIQDSADNEILRQLDVTFAETSLN